MDDGARSCCLQEGVELDNITHPVIKTFKGMFATRVSEAVQVVENGQNAKIRILTGRYQR